MSLTRRDRRALLILMLGAFSMGLYRLKSISSDSGTPQDCYRNVPLERLGSMLREHRRSAAALPQKQETLRRLTAELASREGSLIEAATQSEAQAELLEVVKTALNQQDRPLEIKKVEFVPGRELDETYAEISVVITTECTIDEIVNVLSDLTAAPQAIATNEITLTVENQKLKTLQARLRMSALVRKSVLSQGWSAKT